MNDLQLSLLVIDIGLLGLVLFILLLKWYSDKLDIQNSAGSKTWEGSQYFDYGKKRNIKQ